MFRLAPFCSLCCLLHACSKPPLVHEQTPAEISIHFSNQIREDRMVNMLTYEYLNNGGGVGIADFNNDCRPDIYFTASMGSNGLCHRRLQGAVTSRNRIPPSLR